MDKWLKLNLVKRFVNIAVRMLNRAVPVKQPTYPQTKALAEIYVNMYKAFSVETYCGRFDDVPFQKIASLKDKNFLHVLQFTEKLLTYLGEMDRYYRAWLGLSLLLAADQVKEVTSSLDYLETLQSIRAQWNYPLQPSFIPKEHFDGHRRDFLEIDWTFGLSDMARFKFGKPLFPAKNSNKNFTNIHE
jgi:hypothetical protein